MRRRIAVAAAVLAVLAAGTAAIATPGEGITVETLGSKTLRRVVIRQTEPSVVVTVRVLLEPGGTTGWHSHPSNVFVAVEAGDVTLFHSDCTTQAMSAGVAFRERPNVVHNVVNDGATDAILIATFVGLPPDTPGRTDEADPCA
jgi:quercetin dioxygenase-like cupin family protein